MCKIPLTITTTHSREIRFDGLIVGGWFLNGAVGRLDQCSPNAEDICPSHAYLDKTDISGFLSEALTADVESIFADETGFVGADSAWEKC